MVGYKRVEQPPHRASHGQVALTTDKGIRELQVTANVAQDAVRR
jgi:hypothetical protein